MKKLSFDEIEKEYKKMKREQVIKTFEEETEKLEALTPEQEEFHRRASEYIEGLIHERKLSFEEIEKEYKKIKQQEPEKRRESIIERI